MRRVPFAAQKALPLIREAASIVPTSTFRGAARRTPLHRPKTAPRCYNYSHRELPAESG
jgi:hypothetical protein